MWEPRRTDHQGAPAMSQIIWNGYREVTVKNAAERVTGTRGNWSVATGADGTMPPITGIARKRDALQLATGQARAARTTARKMAAAARRLDTMTTAARAEIMTEAVDRSVAVHEILAERDAAAERASDDADAFWTGTEWVYGDAARAARAEMNADSDADAAATFEAAMTDTYLCNSCGAVSDAPGACRAFGGGCGGTAIADHTAARFTAARRVERAHADALAEDYIRTSAANAERVTGYAPEFGEDAGHLPASCGARTDAAAGRPTGEVPAAADHRAIVRPASSRFIGDDARNGLEATCWECGGRIVNLPADGEYRHAGGIATGDVVRHVENGDTGTVVSIAGRAMGANLRGDEVHVRWGNGPAEQVISSARLDVVYRSDDALDAALRAAHAAEADRHTAEQLAVCTCPVSFRATAGHLPTCPAVAEVMAR